MLKRIHFLLLLLVFTSSLACQAVYRAYQPTPTPELKRSSHSLPAPASPSPLPPTATPTSTLLPTSTPTPVPPTPAITPAPIQFDVFEDLWQTVKEEYLYPDFNGLDWDAVHDEYRQRIEAGLTPEEFYLTMAEMIASLGDEHSVFLSPQEVSEEQDEFSGENDYTGIGVLTSAVPERALVTIIVVFPGSPAEDAGLQPHDNILAVDGLPILEGEIDRRSLLRGREGDPVELTVLTPGQEPREVTLNRRRIQSSVPVPYTLLTSPDGKRIGYILMATFADETTEQQVEEALRILNSGGRLDGLILDNRQNPGGIDIVARGTLGFFTHGVVGYFVNRQEERALKITGNDIYGSLHVPLAVLVGQNTASFGEIFSGVLQDSGRATIIGDTTEGNVEILWGYDFQDGSRAWIAHESFRPYNHPEQDWEQSGIVPDIQVSSQWDEVTLETDPVIQAALDHLEEVEVQVEDLDRIPSDRQLPVLFDKLISLTGINIKIPAGSGTLLEGPTLW